MFAELQRAAKLAAEYLATLDHRPVSSAVDPTALLERLGQPPSETGEPAVQVIEQLARDATPSLLNTQSGRFFGWVIGGALPVTVAADWLTSAWDQNAAAYACSPAAAVIEEATGSWLKQWFDLPPHASFAFVTGCQMAHFTALAAARHRLLAKRGWDVEERGLAASPQIRVLAGAPHETLLRALRQLGIGSGALSRVPCHADGRLDVLALERELARGGDAPTVVALAAGEINRGVFDDFGAACEAAHARGAWVHVDGAFGLWAKASPRLRHLAADVERADSWATDAHKWLNVPYDGGVAFVADAEAHRAAMSVGADYEVKVRGTRDQHQWGPDWSRRARGMVVYAALRHLGRVGLAEQVERCCELALQLVDGLGELPGVLVVHRPTLNQGLVRFERPEDSAEAGDLRTERVIARINQSGEAWFGPSLHDGRRVMRVSVCNHRTTRRDVARAIEAARAALADQ